MSSLKKQDWILKKTHLQSTSFFPPKPIGFPSGSAPAPWNFARSPALFRYWRLQSSRTEVREAPGHSHRHVQGKLCRKPRFFCQNSDANCQFRDDYMLLHWRFRTKYQASTNWDLMNRNGDRGILWGRSFNNWNCGVAPTYAHTWTR